MLKNRVPTLALLIVIVATLLPTGFVHAQNGSITIQAVYQSEVVVTRHAATISELATLDPQVGSDIPSLTAIENLFHGLTNFDSITNQVVPELATHWETSVDGLVWTFTLRDDVLWYHYDPSSDTSTALRAVVADDLVYSIKRACDSRLGGGYGTVAAAIIQGCDIVNETTFEETTDDLVYGDTIKASAPDATTLVIETQVQAAYFLNMTAMPIFYPVHPETVAEFGAEWTAPGNIVTNGAYFVQEITPGVRRIFVRNPQHLADLEQGGNIAVIEFTVVEDIETGFSLYQDHGVDATGVPAAAIETALATYPDEVHFTSDLAVFYFGFNYDTAPFNDVHVRRAFSAILDRELFIEKLRTGRGVPMIHLVPPGIAHALPIDEIGVGFDPKYARAEMELAGYPQCDGFPHINIVTYEGVVDWAEFLAYAAVKYLGCSPDLFNPQALEFSKLLEVISPATPPADRPHIWTLGWSPEYPDANNWMQQVLSCYAINNFLRPCTVADEIIQDAARTLDSTERAEMYRTIETAFFGVEGEFPIAPLFLRRDYTLVKPWYTGPFENDLIWGGVHWDAYSIDMTAKLAARGEG